MTGPASHIFGFRVERTENGLRVTPSVSVLLCWEGKGFTRILLSRFSSLPHRPESHTLWPPLAELEAGKRSMALLLLQPEAKGRLKGMDWGSHSTALSLWWALLLLCCYILCSSVYSCNVLHMTIHTSQEQRSVFPVCVVQRN